MSTHSNLLFFLEQNFNLIIFQFVKTLQTILKVRFPNSLFYYYPKKEATNLDILPLKSHSFLSPKQKIYNLPTKSSKSPTHQKICYKSGNINM